MAKDIAVEALDQKHHALLITGNIFDLYVDEEAKTLYYRPLYLAEKLHEQGVIVLRYSRSSGFNIHRYSELLKTNQDIQDILQQNGLSKFIGNRDISPTEVVEIFRSFKSIATIKQNYPFAFMVDFIPHLTSGHNADREMQIVAETISDIANLPSVQKAGNMLVIYAYDESNLSPLLKVLHRINYTYPDLAEYIDFFQILASRNLEFAATSLSPEQSAKLARGLNLTQLASLFREAKAKNIVIGKTDLIREKERLIDQISERTLTVLPTEITFNDMAGLEVPKRILQGFAEKLAQQDPTSPRAILLAGPPGTGKTTIVSAFANASGFNLVELSDEIKSKFVGESEERLSLALNLIQNLAPVILFIDEIDQAFTNRTSANLDGGVSSHYLKTIFKFAARDDLRGKICILGCSNTPQLLDPALISRFITIPLLEATPLEMAAIFPKIQKRLTGIATIDQEHEQLLEGCSLLYQKGASPRQIFEIINKTTSEFGPNITEQQILKCCNSFRSNGDPISTAYSSLSAIRITAFEDYLPWSGNSAYPLPWYLQGILNPENGSVNDEMLNQRINEFKAKSRY